jgi:NAD-dependent dihydropyrimidine dehydrogenase PreA subunit
MTKLFDILWKFQKTPYPISRYISRNQKECEKNMPALVNADECSGCGSCVDECPSEAITLDEEKGIAVVDQEECVECGACEEACPNQAIKVEE